jgi:N-acetylmuramoyl-L-alanine amidase
MNRFAAPLTALFFSGCVLPSVAAALNGQSYVPLANWASANGLKTVWLARGSEIGVTNRTTRLVFNVDSHDAEINGVHVLLSFPVANIRGVPLIAQLDVDKTVQPLLFPSRYAAPEKIMTICLDPGHGGKDTGNRVGGIFWRNEKTYTLAFALELRNQLKAAGFNVILTRSKDTFVELPARPAIANKAGADLFISLHFNGSPADPKNVEGPETYSITPVGASSSNAQGEGADHAAVMANRFENNSLLLAYQVQKSLVQNLGADDRGARRARFAVLTGAAMPAILVEGGYMSHPAEGNKIFGAAYRRQMAQALVKGILAYQKLTAPEPPPASHATAKSSGAAVPGRAR